MLAHFGHEDCGCGVGRAFGQVLEGSGGLDEPADGLVDGHDSREIVEREVVDGLHQEFIRQDGKYTKPVYAALGVVVDIRFGGTTRCLADVTIVY